MALAEEQEIRDLFKRQIEAENAHDIGAFASVMANTAELADSVALVSRAGRFSGIQAVLQRFEGYFRGTWKLDPDWSQISIVRLAENAYHLYAPTKVTVGPSGKEPQTLSFLINEVVIRTADGWRFTTIIPVLEQ